MAASPRSLKDLAWSEFERLSLSQKAPLFSVDGRLYHVLIAQQFDRVFLDRLGELATWVRQIAKSKAGMDFLRSLLTHKTAMLYFSQPSTRTFLSFHSACQILGMRITAKQNSIEHPAQHPGSILDRLLLAEMQVVALEIFHATAFVHYRHGGCRARAGGRFLKQQCNMPSPQ